MLEQTVPRDALPAWLQEYPIPSGPVPVAAEAPVGEAQAEAQDDVDAEAEAAEEEAEDVQAPQPSTHARLSDQRVGEQSTVSSSIA